MRTLILFLIMSSFALAEIPTLDIDRGIDGVPYLTQDGVRVGKAINDSVGKYVLKLERTVGSSIKSKLSASSISASGTALISVIIKDNQSPIIEATGDEVIAKIGSDVIREQLRTFEGYSEVMKKKYPNGFRIQYQINAGTPTGELTNAGTTNQN